MSARRGRLGAVLAWLAALACTLPPLLLLGLLAQATLARTAPPVHTGDALSDAYLQALVDEDLVLDPEAFLAVNVSDVSTIRVLSNGAWQRLEQRFSGDARFWLLCYHCHRDWSLHRGAMVGNLDQARACANADWRVYFWLVQDYSSYWEAEAAHAIGLGYPGSSSPLEEHYAYLTKCSAEVELRHGSERRALFSELARLGANQAQAQYLLARYAFESGDIAGTIRFLEQGNAAAKNDSAFGTPFTPLLAAAEQGQPLSSDRLLTGNLAYAHSRLPLPNLNRHNRRNRYLAHWAVQHGNTAALNTLLRYNCRVASAQGDGALEAQVAVSGMQALLKTYETSHPGWTTEQARRGAVLKLELAQLRGAVQGMPGYGYQQPSVLLLSFPAQVWQHLVAISNGGRGTFATELERNCSDFIKYAQAAAPLHERLAAFDPPVPW